MKTRTQTLSTLAFSITLALAAGCASETTDHADDSLVTPETPQRENLAMDQ